MSRSLSCSLRANVACVMIAAAALPFTAAAAQTATFAGAVVRDTLEHGISGARITLLGAGRSDTTDSKGEFKFTNLPAGKIAVMIRRVGFSPMVDSVDLINGQSVEREYVMDVAPVALDSVRVLAQRQEHLSATMSMFEEHRKAGMTSGAGHFITEEILAKNDARRLQDVLTSFIPGLKVYRPFPKQLPMLEYLSSGRGGSGGFHTANECPVTLYVDGLLRFNPANGTTMDQFYDINQISTADIAGVEYYAGGASLPLQYNGTTNGCGVLVLWQRQQVHQP